MLAPFSKIVIDKQEEAKFRRRALKAYPMEYIEALWGFIRKDVLYVCVFMPMEQNVDNEGTPIKPKNNSVSYAEDELDSHEDEAKEHRLTLLGTVHTHPDCSLTHFSEGDLLDQLDSQETVFGICAIETIETKSKGKKCRRQCKIAYWPSIRPLHIEHRDWDAKQTAKKKSRARKRQ